MFDALSDSQNPSDGVGGPGGTGCCHGNGWCWWHFRDECQCQETLEKETSRSRNGRCNRETHLLQTGLCFWWSCKNRGDSLNTHFNDVAHVQYTLEITYLLMELILGTLSCSHTRSRSSLSLISQANMVGLVCFRLRIICTTLGVATLGLEPPITPGLMLPVSLYLNEHWNEHWNLSGEVNISIRVKDGWIHGIMHQYSMYKLEMGKEYKEHPVQNPESIWDDHTFRKEVKIM